VQITNIVSLERDKRSAGSAESNCQVISLLDILEKENQELRRAVIDLSLETLRLREGHWPSRAPAISKIQTDSDWHLRRV
jgi:hypothetical protein